MEPSHPIVVTRLAFVFLCALPAVRELYHYLMDPRRVCCHLIIRNYMLTAPFFLWFLGAPFVWERMLGCYWRRLLRNC
jgi:hypothetical protein